MNDGFFAKVGTMPRTNRATLERRLADEQPSDPAKPETGASRWSAHEGKYWGSAMTMDALPSGLYRCGQSPNIGYFFDKMVNDTDQLLRLPDSHAEEVLAEIKEFSTLKPAFTQRGFLYKRGVLLWGPPGSGKTCALRLLIEMVIRDLKGLAVYLDHPVVASGCLTLLRKIERERQVICILEDLDALVERFGENEYLSMLDGESQIDNCIFVATTNYPERLDRRFVDRPSRFDTIRYVGMPSAAARAAYLKAKEPDLTPEALDEYVAMSDGFSIAHLRELVILTQCFKRPLADATKRLNAMRVRQPSSEQHPDAPAFGFAGAQ